MTIGSVNSLSSLASLSGITSTQGSSSTPSAGDATSTEMSSLMDMLKQLKDLKSSDPQKFKEVMSEISDKLKEQADSSGDKFLSELSDRFAQAGESGDLSLVKPPDGTPPEKPRGAAAYASGNGPAMTPDDIAQLIKNAISDVTGSSSTATA